MELSLPPTRTACFRLFSTPLPQPVKAVCNVKNYPKLVANPIKAATDVLESHICPKFVIFAPISLIFALSVNLFVPKSYRT